MSPMLEGENMPKMTKTHQRKMLGDAQKKILKVWQENYGHIRYLSPAMKQKLADMCNNLDPIIDKLK